MKNPFDPAAAGAETAGDVAAFCVGACVGGLVDGALNFIGLAEPLVVAGMCGSGALGLKKMIFDVPASIRKKNGQYKQLRLEAELRRKLGDEKIADLIEVATELGETKGLTGEQIRHSLNYVESDNSLINAADQTEIDEKRSLEA